MDTCTYKYKLEAIIKIKIAKKFKEEKKNGFFLLYIYVT